MNVDHTTTRLPIPGEIRLWECWSCWAQQSQRPSIELEFLKSTGRLEHYPELAAMIGVPQDPQWHPEGDVWTHTLHVCDAAAEISRREALDGQESEILLLSALCHDLGKPTTTEFRNGRWRASGHPQAGVPIARCFLTRIECPDNVLRIVLPLVAEHLVHAQPTSNARSVRRLIRRLRPATVPQLVRLIESDLNGRPPLPGHIPPTVIALLNKAESIPVETVPLSVSPDPLIRGRHLIEMGYPPSDWFGVVLNECLEAQVQGKFDDVHSGRLFLRSLLLQHAPTAPPPDDHAGCESA